MSCGRCRCVNAISASIDTPSVNLTGDGSPGTPLQADVIIDPDPTNQLVQNPAGLFVPPDPGFPAVWANASLGDDRISATVPAAPAPLFIQLLTAAEGGFVIGGNPWQLIIPEDGVYVVSGSAHVCDNPVPGCYPVPATQRMLTMNMRIGPNIKFFGRRTTTAPETISGAGGDEATTVEGTFMVRATAGTTAQLEATAVFDIAGIPYSFDSGLGVNRLWIVKVAD